MMKAYKEYDLLKSSFKNNSDETVKQFSWESAAKKIMELF
jgi:hypothetical protein